MGVKCIECTYADGRHRSWIFHCPGCDNPHECDDRWGFNGNVDSPTFDGSVRVSAGGTIPECHSFVRDGRIQFLNDSGHALAGKTVDLPDWDDVHPFPYRAGGHIYEPKKKS